METHAITESRPVERGSSPINAVISDIREEMRFEPRAVWALWLACLLVLVFVLLLLSSPWGVAPRW